MESTQKGRSLELNCRETWRNLAWSRREGSSGSKTCWHHSWRGADSVPQRGKKKSFCFSSLIVHISVAESRKKRWTHLLHARDYFGIKCSERGRYRRKAHCFPRLPWIIISRISAETSPRETFSSPGSNPRFKGDIVVHWPERIPIAVPVLFGWANPSCVDFFFFFIPRHPQFMFWHK